MDLSGLLSPLNPLDTKIDKTYNDFNIKVFDKGGEGMSKREIEIFEDLKRYYVRMALETNKHATTAKAAGIHPNTLRKWIKKYELEIKDQMESEGISIINHEPTEMEYKKKYEVAMKLLGEKELEVALLKDALKKNN